MQKITQEQLNELIQEANENRKNKIRHIFKDLDMHRLTMPHVTNLSQTSFENCKMSNMMLAGVDFSHSRFIGCDLRNSNLRSSNFAYAELVKCDFNKSNMTNSIIKYSKLVDVDFSEVRLAGVSFIFAQIKNINVEKSTLLNANFAEVSFDDDGLVGLDKVTTLQNVIGDGVMIKTLRLPMWSVAVTSTHIQIGCQYHPIEKWWSFTDDELNEMSAYASAWWKEWKEVIKLIATKL